MRLIDADALKKEYRMADRCEDCKRNSRDCQHVYSWTLMDVCSMLDDAPTIGGWISVKDRLPDKTPCEYLVVNNGVVGTAIYHDGMWIAPTWRVNVTHWQAMPEPPKEEK